MPKGSCVCGDFTYELDGAPHTALICHCVPCQKSGGPNGSYDLIIKQDKVKKLAGKTKSFVRKGDSGKELAYDLCDKCGTTMWCTLEIIPGMLIVKAGTLDDPEYLEHEGRPVKELFTRNRPSWCCGLEGVEQREGA